MNDWQPATVYAVIPTFNRFAYTKACIEQLKRQTYGPICIIVSDGGSHDGTVERVRADFPDVVALQSEKELWWSGAMEAGIQYALASSRSDDDCLLMLNNDTEFDCAFVGTLVRASQEHHAAVGALTTDSADPRVILEAGVTIDWERYAFRFKTDVGDGERYNFDVDVLPGRGTLVPLYMIRRAGAIDVERFPHYIADYEFFCRLKRHGFPLGVTYETRLRLHRHATGLSARPGEGYDLLDGWKLLMSRRSMNNIFDHLRFVDAAAPPELRAGLKRRLVLRPLTRAVRRFKIALVSKPKARYFGDR